MNDFNFVDGNYAHDKGIKCPICGDEYCHIKEMGMPHGGRVYAALLNCESNSHEFRVWLFENKGKVFFEREVLEDDIQDKRSPGRA